MNRRIIKTLVLVLMAALLAVGLLVGAGCSEEESGVLKAAFNADITSGGTPLEVQFNDKSTGEVTGWEWDFDNDSTVDSTAQNPSYTYDTTGKYTVSLKVTGPDGSDTETKVDYINVKVTTIKLGILGPLTGPVAGPYRSNFWGLHDFFEYMQEEDPIPGVKFELIDFDTQYDSSKALPGYDYVRDRGAMAIISLSSVDHEVLAPYTADDEFPIFGHSATPPVRENPGWTFYDGCAEGDLMVTTLDWISKNVWDYDSGKPKIGAVGMNLTTGKAVVEAVEDYCTENSDMFEWVSGELAAPTTTDWTTEVNRLKDCDYVVQGIGGSGGVKFVAQYIGAGGNAKLLTTMVGVSAWSAIESLVPLESLEGTIYMSEIGDWQSDDFPILKKALGLLYENHSKSDADYEAAGVIGYPNAIIHGSMMWEIIKGAVAEYGAANLTSETLYEYVCAGISIPIEDYEPYTLSETDRQGQDYAALYEYSADDADFLRISDWLPML